MSNADVPDATLLFFISWTHIMALNRDEIPAASCLIFPFCIVHLDLHGSGPKWYRGTRDWTALCSDASFMVHSRDSIHMYRKLPCRSHQNWATNISYLESGHHLSRRFLPTIVTKLSNWNVYGKNWVLCPNFWDKRDHAIWTERLWLNDCHIERSSTVAQKRQNVPSLRLFASL